MNLVKLICVSFLSLTLLHQCDKGGKTNTNNGNSSSAPIPSPANGDLAVRTWYQSFVHTSPPKVHELPFRLPDSGEHEVFEFGFVRFVATDNPFGGHPDNDVGDPARKELRDFMKGLGADDLFYNGLGEFSETGPDLLTEVALVEARNKREVAARQWVVNKFQLRKSVSESVEHRWNTTPPTAGLAIPQTLADFVQSEFQSLKKDLPADQQARLAGWHTSVGSPPDASVGESLWLKQTSNVLWISPFLIRGLLLESVQKPAEDEYNAAVTNESFTTRFLESPDVRNAVSANFKKAIRYLLAHSMGHVTIVSSAGLDKEVAIDQFAFSLLSTKDVGPFVQFLDDAVLVNEANSLSWGVEASNDGKTVSARIKSLL